ncbi:MAG: hypothetical protein IKH86_00160 [Prevotella sp.]|nr:hypothetical protein [Prevotella sp.]
MMSTKDYIKPAIKLQVMEQQLMAAMSFHDEEGDEQLGKRTTFDESTDEKIETGVPKTHSVWEE